MIPAKRWRTRIPAHPVKYSPEQENHRVAAGIMKVSFRNRGRSCRAVVNERLIRTQRARIRPIMAIMYPMMLARPIAEFLVRDASLVTVNPGSDVPNTTTVSPIVPDEPPPPEGEGFLRPDNPWILVR
jgi:hypothetical protein